MRKSIFAISVVTCAIDPTCARYLVPFIQSIMSASLGKRVEIIIRDNGLKSSTRTLLRGKFPYVKVVGNGINVNFSRGINEASRYTHASLLYVANVDSFVEKHLFTNLIEAFNSDSTIGVTAPVVYRLSQKKTISERDLPVLHYSSTTGRLTPFLQDQLVSLKSIKRVEWVSGCGMMVRRDVWEKLNGFDEKFRAYWEDADFCLRIKKLGLRVMVVPHAQLWHQGSIVYGKDSPEKIYRLVKSGLYFTRKHASLIGVVLVNSYTVLLTFTKCIRVLLGNNKEQQLAYIRGVKDYFSNI